MLALDSPRWAALHHAYGPAGEIPAKLTALEEAPDRIACRSGPRHSRCHQDNVRPVACAAVPHLVDLCRRQPTMPWSTLQPGLCIGIGQ
ncbi:MAG: hypothetical protein AAFZ09_20780, partial [Pseudomonadota bacterium]